jgi:hypothetical protein
MLVAKYKTKKDLKNSVGTRFRYEETSMFGNEFPSNGTGKVVVVGPGAYDRKWYAEVWVENFNVTKVK